MTSKMPEWIHDACGRGFECTDGEKIEEALRIAWEALEHCEDHHNSGKSCYGCLTKAKEAMERIRSFGGK